MICGGRPEIGRYLSKGHLSSRLEQPLAPAYYIMPYGAICLGLMWSMTETNLRALSE